MWTLLPLLEESMGEKEEERKFFFGLWSFATVAQLLELCREKKEEKEPLTFPPPPFSSRSSSCHFPLPLGVMPTARTRKKRPAVELEMEQDLEQEWLRQKNRHAQVQSDSFMQQQQQQQHLPPLHDHQPIPAVPVSSSSSFCEPQSPFSDTDTFSQEPQLDETDLESFFSAFNVNPQSMASSNHLLLDDEEDEEDEEELAEKYFFLLFTFFFFFPFPLHSIASACLAVPQRQGKAGMTRMTGMSSLMPWTRLPQRSQSL